MMSPRTTYRHVLFCILLLFGTVLTTSGAKKHRILIITSYNPDTQKMYNNLSDFSDQYKLRGGSDTDISIESMNCKNLSEAHLWKNRMAELLAKYTSAPPSLVILLGQEAWASYLSQSTAFARNIPCMGALVSSSTVLLPNDSTDLHTWKPQSVEYTDIKDFKIVGGIYYKYDVERNVDLIKKFVPKTKQIAFLSDNTFGGLAMQALVEKVLGKDRHFKLQMLDGRTHTLLQICNLLKNISPSTALLIGTWRIDSSENFVLANTTGTLRDSNPKIPAFTMASVGLGNWAIGGYTPEYSLMGQELGNLAYTFLHGQPGAANLFEIRPNHYIFDQEQLMVFNYANVKLPDGAVRINQDNDFYGKHRKLILWVLASLLFLGCCLVFALYYIVRIRRLKDILEKQSEDLMLAKDKAEEANRLKTSFIANMSHEIRTPLNAIVGFSELQAMDGYTTEERMQFGNIIKENSALLLNLINDILDISRIESGRITIDCRPCEVVKLCHTSLLSVKQARHLENVEYQEDFHKEQLNIKTDPVRLKQVIINLLTNASKFTKEGHIKLSFSIDEEAKTITFAVTDTGIGIPKDKAEYIFERFVKLNPFAQGTGLGLALCKIIVECMGGRIWVDTTYTQGARFMFTHPLHTVSPDEEIKEDYL